SLGRSIWSLRNKCYNANQRRGRPACLPRPRGPAVSGQTRRSAPTLIASISQRLSKPVRRVGMISSRVSTVESARPIDFNRRYATGVAILATLPALKDRPKLKWSLRDRKPSTHISNNFGNDKPDGRATDTSNSIGENTMQVGLIGLGIMG